MTTASDISTGEESYNGRIPKRLCDNIHAGYAVWITWAAIIATTQACASYIEQANARDKKLITNSRNRRLRNA